MAHLGLETLLDAAGSREEGLTPALIGLATMILGATTVFAELRSDLDRIWRCRPSRTGGIAKLLLSRFLSFLLVTGDRRASAFLARGQHLPRHPRHVLVRQIGSAAARDRVLHLVRGGDSAVRADLQDPAEQADRMGRRVGRCGGDFRALLGRRKFLIALYISHTAVDSTFGAAGALVLVIVWVYYSAQVFFLGAEFTREYALRLGSRRRERPMRKSLTEMNAAYDSLVNRAQDIVRGNAA